jgi:hypothetical protein
VRYRFSTAGAAQLAADLAAICRVVDKAVGPGVAEVGLRKCLEGASLVGLPVTGGHQSVNEAVTAAGGEDDWTASWDADAGSSATTAPAQGEQDAETQPARLGLWDVEKRLFADNQAARDVLDDLGLETLGENEARALLGRRVELAG